ncbi:MAG: glycosyltransferase, partial [Prochlorococcus sp.]
TFHAGIPEVVVDGCTGFLAQEGDVVNLADGLERLLLNSDLAGRMGEAAAAHARTQFTIEEHLRSVANVLRDSATS